MRPIIVRDIPFTPAHRGKLRALRGCKLFGVWERRFVTDLLCLPPAYCLSAKQEALIDQLYSRYQPRTAADPGKTEEI